MPERRMFAKTIVTSDAFLDMPATARCLYFTLCMFADDDGFVNNPRSIMRQCGAHDDDMKILIAKSFVLLFETGVIVIKHWRIHNYIQRDRYHPTKYQEEKGCLIVNEKDGYSWADAKAPAQIEKPLTDRQRAYEESELPYSFDYKMRTHFVGKPCPICGKTMSYENNLVQPTIQHNLPISKGGKHEIGNISVVCRSCNTSIKDNPTEKLNADEVAKAWDEMTCIQSVSKVDTEVRLGKVSKGKDIKNISPKITSDEVDVVPQNEVWFTQFWEKYPKKVDKVTARKTFDKKCKSEADLKVILEGLERWIACWKDPQYIPYPSKWLNSERYNDNPTSAEDENPLGFLPF
jgi:hypothetical protein